MIAIIMSSLIAIVLIQQSLGQDVAGSCTTLPISHYKAVNLIDKRLMAKEAHDWLSFRAPSMHDRLNEIKSMGLNTIRVPFYWEAYVVNNTAFVNGLREISTTADHLGMCVVYDFHQSHTSSHFGGASDNGGGEDEGSEDGGSDENSGGASDNGGGEDKGSSGGFPSFLTDSYSTDKSGELTFWSDYYDNNISYNGSKTWDLQFDFIKNEIIDHVDSHTSTAGYELLNEPPVNDCNQFAKLGDFHTFMGNKIRSVTLKPIYFDRAENQGCEYWNREPYDTLVVPRGVSNIVFAPHIYVTDSPTTLTYLIALAQKWQLGTPLFIGEWGQLPQHSVVTQDMVNNYLQGFKRNNVGWAYWSWDPVFTFAIKDQSYQDLIYKTYLQNGINSIYGN
jgi:hypothetical protein